MKVPKSFKCLALLFCTLVIVSTVVPFTIRNSFAQAQQQIQQAPTIAYKSPWNNYMPISSVGSNQPLCQGGICTQSSNPASTANVQPTNQPQNTGSISSASTNSAQPTTQPQNTGSSSSASTNSADPTKVSTSFKNTFTNSKNLSVNHAFVNSMIIGPDRFRFVTSYWTTSDVSRLIDAGRSSGNVTTQDSARSSYVAPGVSAIGPAFVPRAFFAGFGTSAVAPFAGQFTSAGGGALPLSNLQIEVDRGEGYSTLAIVLQYEGVVSLAGITAGLKLPTGFEAQYPLTDDRHNSDIALANYDGGIRPSQEIVLYFPMYVLPNAPVQVPVLGPLALHFLRSAPRSVGDSLSTTDTNMFAKMLTITNGTNSTMFNNSLGFNRNYSDKSGRLIPYDFINQVIPVIFKATGREVLDVYQELPAGCISGTTNQPTCISAILSKNTPVPINLTFANHGDVPLFNLVVQLDTVLPVITGSSTAGGPVVAPQLPIVVRGQSTYYFTGLGPGQSKTIKVYISSAIDCNTNQALEVDSSYNNVIGVRTEAAQVVGIGTSSGGSCSQQAPGTATTVAVGSAVVTPIHLTTTTPTKAPSK
jgi:hypothetical protein